MNKKKIKSNKDIALVLFIIISLTTSLYSLWNTVELSRATNRALSSISGLNNERVKNKKAILQLQECYNQKATSCIIDLQ